MSSLSNAVYAGSWRRYVPLNLRIYGSATELFRNTRVGFRNIGSTRTARCTAKTCLPNRESCSQRDPEFRAERPRFGLSSVASYHLWNCPDVPECQVTYFKSNLKPVGGRERVLRQWGAISRMVSYTLQINMDPLQNISPGERIFSITTDSDLSPRCLTI